MTGDVKQSTVSVTIGSVTRHYSLWITNAPVAYDYGYTLHVYGDSTIKGAYDDQRLVLVPATGPTATTMSHPQILRYRSGMYVAQPSDLLGATGQGGLEEILWDALHTLHRGND